MFLAAMPSDRRKRFLQKIRLVCPSGPYRRDWLHWWVKTYFGVHIPNVKVCADHDAPFTLFADAFFNESSKGKSNSTFLLLGSRLFAGKTFLAGLLAKTRMVLKSADVYILGGSEDQAKTMQQYIKGEHEQQIESGMSWLHKRAPRHLIKSMTANEVILTNRGRAKALTASQKTVRGKHGTDLFGDEIDEMEWDIFTAALGQTYERGEIGALNFFTSTWQNADGTMSRARELGEEKGWSMYEYCFRETHERYGGHITQATVDRKQSEMTRQAWLTEVELQRPSSGDLIFAQEVIDYLFDPVLGSYEDIVNHDYILIPPAEGETFYHGTDWAKATDFTCIHTMIENPSGPDRLAAWCMRQKEPWPIMFEHHNHRIREYGGPSIFDGTGMAGDMVEDHLTVESDPFDFSNRRRLHQIYSSYVTAIESGEYAYPDIPYLKKAHAHLTRGQLYESTRTSKKNHTPDPVVAAALAREAQRTGSFELMFGRC